MKTSKKQKKSHLKPDPEVILKINRDGRYFKAACLIFNVALFLVGTIFFLWLLQ